VVSTTGALSEAQLAFAGLHQLLLPLLGGLDLRPDPQRRALEAAFGIAEGDAPDLFLIGLATLGVVAERAAETPLPAAQLGARAAQPGPLPVTARLEQTLPPDSRLSTRTYSGCFSSPRSTTSTSPS
jgi:hypothetical protein